MGGRADGKHHTTRKAPPGVRASSAKMNRPRALTRKELITAIREGLVLDLRQTIRESNK